MPISRNNIFFFLTCNNIGYYLDQSINHHYIVSWLPLSINCTKQSHLFHARGPTLGAHVCRIHSSIICNEPWKHYNLTYEVNRLIFATFTTPYEINDLVTLPGRELNLDIVCNVKTRVGSSKSWRHIKGFGRYAREMLRFSTYLILTFVHHTARNTRLYYLFTK